MADREGAKKNKREKDPFYERRGPLLFCKAAGVLAGLMVIAAPFLHWRAVWVKADVNFREGFSLFDIVKKVFSSGYGATANKKLGIVLLLVLILLCGLWILYFALRDQLKPEVMKKRTFIFDRFLGRFRLIGHLLPPLISVLAVIALQSTDVYKFLYNRVEETYMSWQTLMMDGYHDWKLPGIGCLLFFGGIVLYFAAEGLRYLIDTLNEEA